MTIDEAAEKIGQISPAEADARHAQFLATVAAERIHDLALKLLIEYNYDADRAWRKAREFYAHDPRHKESILVPEGVTLAATEAAR